MRRIMNIALSDVPESQVMELSNSDDIFVVCAQNLQGSSNCLGAIQWNSVDLTSEIPVYNYTLRGNTGSAYINVQDGTTDTDIKLLPLQWAVDRAITNLTQTPQTLPFTSETQDWYQNQITERYMKVVRDWTAPALYLTVIGVIYHLAGVVAQERQYGITNLLDSMGAHQIARVGANHLAFSTVYLPGWIALGLVFSFVYFKSSSPATIIFFHIFSGLGQVSWAIFLGNIFNNAQLSGITSSGVSTILAILTSVQAQVHGAGGGGYASGTIYALSFIFPPMNYCFFLQNLARAQLAETALNMVKAPAESNVLSIVIFMAAIFQIFFYLGLSLLIERMVYGKVRTISQTAESGSAVQISGLSKIYPTGSLWKKMLKKGSTVTAVNELSLTIGKGQIYSLLGANGSGKTTTLEMIAAIQNPTSGNITFGPDSKVGICPQKNVLWDNLTVREHIQIWSKVKCVPESKVNSVASFLIQNCDLASKAENLTKNLSGGQKRKVQLAIMFAGGSNVCCIDEASSGLDPVSRRIIWDILLSFRGTHTMILTTHFLDEADILSDRIAVLSKGQLKAEGTAVHLKNTLGEGYRVFISHPGSGSEEIHHLSSASEVSSYISTLESSGVQYRVTGPQLEDVFLNLASADHDEISKNFKVGSIDSDSKTNELAKSIENRRVGFFTQFWAMILKRIIIFRRNPLPDFLLFFIPILVCGLVSSYLSSFPGSFCQSSGRYSIQKYTSLDLSDTMIIPIASARNFNESTPGLNQFLLGMTSYQMDDFDNNKTFALEKASSYFSGDEVLLNSYEEWTQYINANYSIVNPGGVYLDDPVLAYKANDKGGLYSAPTMMNLMTNLRTNGAISVITNFSPFQVPWVLNTGNILQFAVYFGLAMACAPAFTALYPTYERLSKVRAMQYSNGLRVIPLWCAYIFFHFWIIIVTSIIIVAIMVSKLEVMNGPGYMFVVLVLYLVASTLLSYVISLFVTSQLSAFASAAAYQACYLLIYLMGYLCTQAYGSAESIESDILIVHFTISIISPISNLCRCLFVAVNLFGILCTKDSEITYMGDIRAYGGPILYLTLQCIVLLGFLIWYDSGRFRPNFTPFSGLFRRRSNEFGSESLEEKFSNTSDDVLMEVKRVEDNLNQFEDGIALKNVYKTFPASNRTSITVVEDVSFGVVKGECFALLGPNGAGKTTTFNMIRGETGISDGEIYVTGIPVTLKRTLARSKLGVCPQFDAMDKMTVQEILSFYARLRGIPPKEIKCHVDNIIESVGVSRFRTRIASKLSGGNKRKLSLGVALIGNPRVLLLDEPSSGMDAFAKRIMWRTLASVSQGRSIILTTHSMEEADALANRAGILAKSMLACGSTDTLRDRYGNGYHVHIVCNSAPHTTIEESQGIIRWMQKVLPGARVEDRMYQGQIKMSIPTTEAQLEAVNKSDITNTNSGDEFSQVAHPHKLSEIFQILERSKVEMGIDSYSVSHTSLEEVFLKIVGHHQEILAEANH